MTFPIWGENLWKLDFPWFGSHTSLFSLLFFCIVSIHENETIAILLLLLCLRMMIMNLVSYTRSNWSFNLIEGLSSFWIETCCSLISDNNFQKIVHLRKLGRENYEKFKKHYWFLSKSSRTCKANEAFSLLPNFSS